MTTPADEGMAAARRDNEQRIAGGIYKVDCATCGSDVEQADTAGKNIAPVKCGMCGSADVKVWKLLSDGPSIRQIAERALQIIASHEESKEADAGFDGGEFSGPAHDRAEEKEVSALAEAYSFTYEEVMAEIQRQGHSNSYRITTQPVNPDGSLGDPVDIVEMESPLAPEEASSCRLWADYEKD